MTSSNNTPYPLGDGLAEFFPLLRDLVATMESGVEDSVYAFAVIEDLNQFQAHVTRTESTAVTLDRGIVLRIFAGLRNFEFAANEFDAAQLHVEAKKLREQALAHVEAHPAPAYKPPTWSDEPLDDLSEPIRTQILAGGGGARPSADVIVHFGSSYDSLRDETGNRGKIVKHAGELKAAIDEAGGGELAATGTLIRQKTKSKLFVDRTRMMSQSLLTSLVYLYAVSPQGKTARHISGGLAGSEVADEITPEVIRSLADITMGLDSAPRIKPGRYRIITGPDVTGVIAHEAFGHTQEGDTCRLGRSCAPGLRNSKTRIGNEHATIINNAGVFAMGNTAWGVNGTHFFDDEGFIARYHTLLKEGYLSSPMNDLLASVTGDMNGPAPRQSNGKRESWRRPLIPRQTNTYFTSGDKTLDELAKLCGNGYIAEFAHGGMEDPKGMGLTAGTEYLEEVKDGKRTGRLFLGPRGGHVELSDPVPRLLGSIIAKSMTEEDGTPSEGEPHNKWGGCGKYHKELVEAGCGGPWILWEGITCG